MKKSTFKYKNFTTAILLMASCALSTVQAKQYKWDMPNEYPGTSIQGIGDKRFGEILAEKSAGKIEVIHHFGGALGYKSKDQLDAVEMGAVVIANTFIPPLGGVNPIFLLSSLPFLSDTPEEARTLYEVAKPLYKEVLEDHNQILLYASPWPSSGLWGKDAYTTKADVNNLKMRSYDANGTRTFKNIGAAPIQLSWADIVPQLSTGGISAVLTSIESGLNASFNDYTKYFTEINYDSTINIITMNRDVFDGLPKDLQEAVLSAAKETEDFVWENIHKAIANNYEKARERGVTIVTEVDEALQAELRAAAEPVISEWVKRMGSKGKEFLDQYRAAIAKN
ncbi:TRAP transporter substrate-binding protein [Oligella urethralis]|uniref:TRAP transporter substrate-binding protein n=1 Tax=Oligella urethralis TaxID=90245 RepID=UPI001CED4E0E|nr:TRAP transporter substrate-binding protein [Oligella urethralis]